MLVEELRCLNVSLATCAAQHSHRWVSPNLGLVKPKQGFGVVNTFCSFRLRIHSESAYRTSEKSNMCSNVWMKGLICFYQCFSWLDLGLRKPHWATYFFLMFLLGWTGLGLGEALFQCFVAKVVTLTYKLSIFGGQAQLL